MLGIRDNVLRESTRQVLRPDVWHKLLGNHINNRWVPVDK